MITKQNPFLLTKFKQGINSKKIATEVQKWAYFQYLI